MLLSTFESVSLAAAHAYWNMTGRPQAVFVHVDAGTQNLGAMVHNVLRGRAGVVVIAGKTPYGEEEGPSGGRDRPIQWQQDVPDQPGIVRGYAKWIQEITRPEMLDRAIGRAVQVAASSPAGMAYLTVSRDVLMDPPRLDHSRVTGFPVATPPAADPAAVARIAAALAAAQAPVLVTSRVGRTEAGFTAVTALADLAGLPVTGRLDTGTVNISSHPPGEPAEPGRGGRRRVGRRRGPRGGKRRAVAARHGDPARGRPGLPRRPRSRQGLDAAVVVPRRRRRPGRRCRRARRGHRRARRIAAASRRSPGGWRTGSPAQRERAAARPGPEPLEGPLTPRGVMSGLNQVIDAEDIVVEEAVTNASAVYEGLERTRPGTLTGPGAPGLGWALGGALGVKLARPDRRVITVTGDGAFLFGVPTSALMMAAEWGTPFLAVILNNKGYRASRLPVYGLFPDGASARRKTAVGTRFNWAPDYPALAAACHAHGERVEKAEDLLPALRRAVAAVDAGRAAVVECVIEQD